eukprot:CAMPEP_0171261666 /NCGR_PEP_ID=MMETSP0790-20130122/56122_1 /TAXON_ID=2925 /ORGANISM="Alexandrium catenella, Strain OF101" /LENGTH=148 /DNA_ID=CAMNT_0011730101 /DNA_START=92 /DNA_END=538 /DNA_ORIENTATION=-
MSSEAQPYCPGETLRKTSLLVQPSIESMGTALDVTSSSSGADAGSRVPVHSTPDMEAAALLPLQTVLGTRPTPAVLGSPEFPTMGSESHHLRLCKPCAFVDTKGCNAGMHCKFCHLCEPGEKKRRKKEKTAFWRAMGRMDNKAAHGQA